MDDDLKTALITLGGVAAMLGMAGLAVRWLIGLDGRKPKPPPICPECGREVLPVEVIGGGVPIEAEWSCPGRRMSQRTWGHVDTLYFTTKPPTAKPAAAFDDGEFNLRAVGG